VDGNAFLGDVKSLCLDICDDIDGLSIYNPDIKSPRAQLSGTRACPEPGYEDVL
jgi:hypothetical protein